MSKIIEFKMTMEDLNSLYVLCHNHAVVKDYIPLNVKNAVISNWRYCMTETITDIVDNLNENNAKALLAMLEAIGYKYKMNENDDPDFIELVLSLEDRFDD